MTISKAFLVLGLMISIPAWGVEPIAAENTEVAVYHHPPHAVPFVVESCETVMERARLVEEGLLPAPPPRERFIGNKHWPKLDKPLPIELQEGGGPPAPPATRGGPVPPLLDDFASVYMSESNSIPPDTEGAAGLNHVVAWHNGRVKMHTKDGTQVFSQGLDYFLWWFGIPGSFDPKIVYDQFSDRYIGITLAGSSVGNSYIKIAVTETSDPTGSWYKWYIPADPGNNTWADYPDLGFDEDGVYITSNQFNSSGYFVNSRIRAFPKQQLLDGEATLTYSEFTKTVFTMRAAITFGSPGHEFLIVKYTTNSFRIFKLNDVLGTPTLTLYGTVTVTSFGGPPDAPQLGDAHLIETNDSSLQNCVYRDGSLWTTHCINRGGRAGVRWYQINVSGASPTLVQSGDVDDDTLHYYFPSIAVNSLNDMGIGFSGSSSSSYVGGYYTGRLAAETSGTVHDIGLLKAGEAPYYETYGGDRNRWGDYSRVCVDPTDDLTFWTILEYADSPADHWGTWWGTYQMSGGLAVDPADDFYSYGGQGGRFLPPDTTYTLTNTDVANPMDYRVSVDVNWVSLDDGNGPVVGGPLEGTLGGGDSLPIQVILNANAEALSPNTYYGTLTFENLDTGLGDTTRGLELEVLNGPPTFQLTVQSVGASSIPIGVSPADANGLTDGATEFYRWYVLDTDVTLTAPEHPVFDKLFTHWRLDGVDQPDGVLTLEVPMDGQDRTAAAYYTTLRVLTVTSDVDSTPIQVSPLDINGDGDGETDFERYYDGNENMELIAPEWFACHDFVEWQVNGFPYTSDLTLTFFLTSSATAYAVYAPFVCPAMDDLDGDGDVDLQDFLAFQTCYTGPGGILQQGCECADADGDCDVDLQDFLAFQTNYTGPS